MKITDVETILLRLPVVREIGDGCQTICVIRVHTDEGIVGIGEAHTNPLAARAVIESPLYSVSAQGLKHILVGEDPRDINRLWDKMYKHTQTYGRRGLLMHALSGIDLALWDILGKSVGQPVYRLLGGPVREKTPVYNTCGGPSYGAIQETGPTHPGWPGSGCAPTTISPCTCRCATWT